MHRHKRHLPPRAIGAQTVIEGSPSIRSRTSSIPLESSTRTRPLPVCCPFHPRPLRRHRPCPSKIRTTKTNSARNQTTIVHPRGSASHRLLPRSRPRAESPIFTAHFPSRPSMSPIPLFHCICTIHVHHRPQQQSYILYNVFTSTFMYHYPSHPGPSFHNSGSFHTHTHSNRTHHTHNFSIEDEHTPDAQTISHLPPPTLCM